MTSLASAVLELGVPRLRHELRKRLGEGADVARATRDGTRVRLEGVRVPVPGAGEITADVVVSLTRPPGSGLPSLRLDAFAARVTVGVALIADVRFTGEEAVGPGLLASGRLHASCVLGALSALDGEPLELDGRLLVDDARARFDGELIGPGLDGRVEGSTGLDGAGLRARVTARGSATRWLAALGAPASLLPRTSDTVEVRAAITGSAARPIVEVALAAEALGFGFGRPRWVPVERIAVHVEGRMESGTFAAQARLGAGGGEIRLDGRFHVATGRADARVTGRDVSLRPLALAAAALGDATLARIGRVSAVREGEISFRGRLGGRGRLDGTLSAREIALSVHAGGAVTPIVVTDVSADVALDHAARTLHVAPFRARVLGAVIEGEGEARDHAGSASGRVSLRGTGGGAALLVTLGAAAGAPVDLRPGDDDAFRPHGRAWVPSDADVAVVVEATSSDAGPLCRAELRVTTETSALEARVRVDVISRTVRGRLRGRLSVADALDLGLFDGGMLPARSGTLDVALAVRGDLQAPVLCGVLAADRLSFPPRVALEDVRALLHVERGRAVWHRVRGALGGGTLEVSALVDRDGPLGGMRACVSVRGVDVDQFAPGQATGRVALDVAIEQHGAEDAPVLGEGTLVVDACTFPAVAKARPSGVPAAIAARNVVAHGPLTARVGLDGTALRFFDATLRLRDADVVGSARVGFDGSVEAHAEVRVRGRLAVPLRVRLPRGDGARASERVDVDVDVLGAALALAAVARRPAATPAPARPAPPLHPALAASLAAIVWSDVEAAARCDD